jgi:hypothetical protein
MLRKTVVLTLLVSDISAQAAQRVSLSMEGALVAAITGLAYGADGHEGFRPSTQADRS